MNQISSSLQALYLQEEGVKVEKTDNSDSGRSNYRQKYFNRGQRGYSLSEEIPHMDKSIGKTVMVEVLTWDKTEVETWETTGNRTLEANLYPLIKIPTNRKTIIASQSQSADRDRCSKCRKVVILHRTVQITHFLQKNPTRWWTKI